MYNMGDTTFLGRPRVMTKEVALASLDRLYGYAARQNLSFVALVIHGGEPLLAGKEWIGWFLQEARRQAPCDVELGLQTNGTLFDRDWLELLASNEVHLGISIDGPPEWHDRHRVNHAGRGTYSLTRRAIDLLVNEADPTGLRWGVLAVANPEYPGTVIYNHLLDIGVQWMDFLWPDYHHDLPPPWPAGSLARYYTDLFDTWFGAGNPKITIRWFETVIKALLGNQSQLDALGPHPLTEAVIETDGSLEPLDVLRTCNNGMTNLGLNVLTHEVDHLRRTELFQLCLHNQKLLPEICQGCAMLNVCGGGYMPHRWSSRHGFVNPSVHCDDLFAVISHIAASVKAEFEEARNRLSQIQGRAGQTRESI
jgi:uncharacterized protein